MIGPKLVTTSVKHVWAGVVIIAAVLVVAGCKLPGAEHTALPATSTPAASPAGTGLPPATVTTVQSKDIGASAGRGATPAARAVATPSPVASPEVRAVETVLAAVTVGPVHVQRSSACTDGLEPMRRYASDHVARWTADGTHILLTYNSEVWAVTPDGSRLWRLAQAWGQTEPGTEFTFGWMTSFDVTRDGKHVVYATCRYLPDVPRAALMGEAGPFRFDYEIAVVGLDGKTPRRLTRHNDFDNYPAWSPDGTRVAFVSNRDVPDIEKTWRAGLYTMAADGADVRRLAAGLEGVAWQPPAWSPDGAKLLYSCWPRRFCVVTLDGEPVGENPLLGGRAVWSPDGARIAVASPQAPDPTDGSHPIVVYSAAPDGSDAEALARGGGVGLVAAQAAEEALATSRAACAAGFVVPAPEANPGLVRDCETLLAARAALFGRLLVNWGSGTSLERWTGVTVAGTPPRVIGLDLRYVERRFTRRNSVVQERLRGTIPPALGALERLQRLNLAGNALSGPIPPELGALSHLTELRLGLNRLTGCIPVDLRRVERHDLEELGLPDCEAAS